MKGNVKRRVRAFLLAMLCVVLVVPAMNVSAATQRQKAIAAYKKYLSESTVYLMPKGSTYWDYAGKKHTYYGTKSASASFCFANIDGDGIPELIVKGSLAYGMPAYTVLTYKYGKIQRASAGYDAAFRGYYPKTGIYLDEAFTDGTPYYERYFRLSGTKTAKVMDKFVYGMRSTEAYYTIGSKDVSIKTFAAKRKSITRGTSLLRAKFYKNTASNRRARLK